MHALLTPALITEAEQRIRTYIRETPLEVAHQVSAMTGVRLYCKAEQVQHTGSFKARGALNALLCLSAEQRSRGVTTASSGNHGAAMAYGMQTLGIPGTIFVPDDASPAKVAAIRAFGVTIQHYGDDCLVTEQYARQYALNEGLHYISPYNDLAVMAGQGTLAVELVRQSEPLDVVFVAVGGGGLMSGIATYLKAHWPGVRMIGCQPEQSAVMAESVRAGRIIELPDLPTLSDGTAGGIEADSLTFPICRDLVDEYLLVSEAEIAAAMRLAITTQHTLIEGAAGVALAAFLRYAPRIIGRRAGVVLCGGNLSLETVRMVVAEA